MMVVMTMMAVKMAVVSVFVFVMPNPNEGLFQRGVGRSVVIISPSSGPCPSM